MLHKVQEQIILLSKIKLSYYKDKSLKKYLGTKRDLVEPRYVIEFTRFLKISDLA